MPYGVLAFYAGLVVWAVIFVDALRRQTYGWFVAWGTVLLLALNVGYFVRGAPDSIAFFIGIYDVLDNAGLPSAGAAAMGVCENNACSVWGDTFAYHPRWGVAFYDRFLNGPDLRRSMLYSHIGFNTIAFVLLHVQLWMPGTGANRTVHRWLGRLTFGSLTLGVASALWMASEHGAVPEYGGVLSQYGFYFMSACTYVCAIMGVAAIYRGDAALHRIWMIRFAGAMWGSYWLFRVVLFFIDPVLRDVDTAAILTVIWGSAPAGIFIAEAWRRRADARGIHDAAPSNLAEAS